MRKENASFETKFISEAGSYLNNADYFAFVELKDYACYVIADGIFGYAWNVQSKTEKLYGRGASDTFGGICRNPSGGKHTCAGYGL